MFEEYPKALYRDGKTESVWGRMCDATTAANAEEEQALIKEGWRLSPEPLDHDADGRKGGARRKPKEASE